MKVDDAVANAFVKEGTSTVFGLLGDGQLTWWAAMASHGVRMIDARDEGASLGMADGWARAAGKTGVCSVTQGPGITRIATSLVTATRYRTPVVVHTAATGFNKDNAMQVLDQEKLVAATGAGYIEILTADYAETAVRQAFYRARLEGRPIVLSVPLDLQKKECEAQGEKYQPSSSMFAGQQRIRPDLDKVEQAVKLISSSRKPAVVVGRGAMSPEAHAVIRRLAKRIGAIVVPTLHAKGALGDDEYYAGIGGLFSTRTLMQLAEEADCVIAVGTSLNNYAVQVRGKSLFPNARVVHIDIAPHLMMGTGKGAECYIQGDAVLTVTEIEKLLADKGASNEGFRTASVRKALLDAARDTTECDIEPGTVDPREAARIMDEKLPSNVGVVVGDGHFMSFPIMLMKKARDVHVFSTAFGSIGQGLATGIGAAVATGQPLLCIEGDGGALQNIQELDTARRLGVKLLYVVMNDDAYGAEYHKLKVKKLDADLAAVPAPDFGAVGRGFGCRGRVAKSSDEIAAAMDEFLAGEGPMVLDVRMSRNVISIPYRRMHLAQDV